MFSFTLVKVCLENTNMYGHKNIVIALFFDVSPVAIYSKSLPLVDLFFSANTKKVIVISGSKLYSTLGTHIKTKLAAICN